MTEPKYIGIENELVSFRDTRQTDFEYDDFKKLLKGKYYSPHGSYLRDYTGNAYYIDGCEIEITTPPIALNKGFASRVTDALILGRNHVIKNTPYLKHTGYSMHWNLTATNNLTQYYRDITIPFQLFGLTPLSLGSNLRNREVRAELLGDSLYNNDQIRAAALLLGTYNVAREKNTFPLIIKEIIKLNPQTDIQIENMVKNGRYSTFNVMEKKEGTYDARHFKETQAQNILELFYEWLSPFVYKLGERDEINNLEAFITGEKKLEMDDIKYFYTLDKEGGKVSGVYQPIDIHTTNGVRSPVIQIINHPEVPLESKLLRRLVDKEKFQIAAIGWDMVNFKNQQYCRISGVEEIYKFVQRKSRLKYCETMDVSEVQSKKIINNKLNNTLKNRTKYEPRKDISAIIEDEEKFMEHLEYNNYKCLIRKEQTNTK